MNRFNEWFAVKMTVAVSTMWAFYAFCIYGLIPKIFPHINQESILYWSNYIQLIFLPLLAVGGAVQGRATEKRDNETHDAVMEELTLARQEREEMKEVIHLLHQKLDEKGAGEQ